MGIVNEHKLPTPTPDVTPETEPYWEGASEQILRLRVCEDCDLMYYYPRAHCPGCLSDRTRWVEASGRGTVYAHTVTRQTHGPFADATPYVLAYVELEEGPRMMTNIVNCDPESIEVGQPVRAVYHETESEDQEVALVRFEPVESLSPR